MLSWKLHVQDYGKIKSAEIEIAPLTLFVGDNNSGKSYLLTLLWGIENLGIESLIGKKYVETIEVEELIKWINVQIEATIAKRTHKVSISGIIDLLEKVLNQEIRKNKGKFVKSLFNNKSVEIGSLRIDLKKLENTIICFQIDENYGDISFYTDGRRKYGFGSSFIEDESYKTMDELKWFMIVAMYSLIMDLGMNENIRDTCIYLPAARTGFMLTKDIINKVGRKNTFNISGEQDMVTPFVRPINQFLDVLGDLTSENIVNNNVSEIICDIEEQMTNGIVQISTLPNKEVQYVPAGYKKGLPLRLTSAVVTELSPLILILKHKNVIERLYYEEPEMCLHPQLQHKMGKMIVHIVNSGIGMVITTHSDIIIQHINNMIKLKKSENCESVCEKFGYSEKDLLSCEQVKIYQLEVKPRGRTEIKELFCGEAGFVVPTFNNALEKIMDEAYEIQG